MPTTKYLKQGQDWVTLQVSSAICYKAEGRSTRGLGSSSSLSVLTMLMKQSPLGLIHLKTYSLRCYIISTFTLDGACSDHSPVPPPDALQQQSCPSFNRSPGHQRVNQAESNKGTEAMSPVGTGQFKVQ